MTKKKEFRGGLNALQCSIATFTNSVMELLDAERGGADFRESLNKGLNYTVKETGSIEESVVTISPVLWPKGSYVFFRFLNEADLGWRPYKGTIYVGHMADFQIDTRLKQSSICPPYVFCVMDRSPGTEQFAKAIVRRPDLIRVETVDVEEALTTLALSSVDLS